MKSCVWLILVMVSVAVSMSSSDRDEMRSCRSSSETLCGRNTDHYFGDGYEEAQRRLQEESLCDFCNHSSFDGGLQKCGKKMCAYGRYVCNNCCIPYGSHVCTQCLQPCMNGCMDMVFLCCVKLCGYGNSAPAKINALKPGAGRKK